MGGGGWGGGCGVVVAARGQWGGGGAVWAGVVGGGLTIPGNVVSTLTHCHTYM